MAAITEVETIDVIIGRDILVLLRVFTATKRAGDAAIWPLEVAAGA
jgi:hypothetical protein